MLIGCKEQKLTPKETVIKYYHSRDTGNYKELKELINDSITIISGSYVMPYNHVSFYEQFKWDSIFKPSYKIVKLEEKNNQVNALVVINSIRNEFLKSSSMICEYEILFNSGKISEIKDLDCTNVDWNTWQKERDSLVNWIKENNPELNGFIYDMTMGGAINYLKAIELYKVHKKTPIN